METEQIYTQDSYIQSAKARVLRCESTERGHVIELDRTLFFPNKGGQPCDLGSIGGVPLLSVDEAEDGILHYCSAPLPVGAEVELRLDWQRRHDFMQQHGGEHLLSACAWRLFDTRSVGFHCAENYSTLDLDIPLSSAQIHEIENMANQIAAENRPIRAYIYESEEAFSHLPIRKQSEGIGTPIRLVEIVGIDLCTCCAPHFSLSGEIGQLKIISAQSLRGGTRLTFLCGKRALQLAQEQQEVLGKIALSCSTDWRSLPSLLEKQAGEFSAVKHALHVAHATLDAYLAAELARGAQSVGKQINLVVAQTPDLDGKRLRSLIGKLSKACGAKSLCLLFSPANETSQGSLQYALAQKGLAWDAGELMQPVNIAVSGKGGGRAALAQGSAPNCPKDLNETIEQLKNYFAARLK